MRLQGKAGGKMGCHTSSAVASALRRVVRGGGSAQLAPVSHIVRGNIYASNIENKNRCLYFWSSNSKQKIKYKRV